VGSSIQATDIKPLLGTAENRQVNTVNSWIHQKYNIQFVTYCIQHNTYNILHTTYYIQHIAYNILHTTYCIQHTTYCIQHTAYNILHTTYCIQHTTYNILHTTYFNINADRVWGTTSIPAVITFVNVVTLLPVTVCLLQTNPFHSCTACVSRRAWVTTKSWIQVCASNPRITRLR